MTYFSVVRSGPSYGHRHGSVMELPCDRADKYTYRQNYRHTDMLIAILRTPTIKSAMIIRHQKLVILVMPTDKP